MVGLGDELDTAYVICLFASQLVVRMSPNINKLKK